MLYVILKNEYTIRADNLAIVSRDGNIEFQTFDTKATSGIRWKTVGFTITRRKCLTGEYANDGYPLKLEHATILLKDDWKKEVGYGELVKVTFTIPQSAVSSALIKAGFGDIKNDDVLYLHGIFQVTHNGKNYGSKKYDLPAITNAESWANSDDFRDRFDIQVLYKAPNEPISIQYKTATGDIIETDTYTENKWVKSGTSISVKLDEEKTYQGKKYKLYKSYIRYYTLQTAIQGYGKNTLKGDLLESVQNRTINQRVGGVQFVAIMKLVKAASPESEKALISERSSPLPYGVITADDRGNSFYESDVGIPATESLYLNVFSQNYLFGYEFENVIGEKEYRITFTKTYHLTWQEIDYDEDYNVLLQDKSTTQTISKTVTVSRPYSYWKLIALEYYTIKDATIQNGALESGEHTLYPKEYFPPNLIYKIYEEDEHVQEPQYIKNVILPSETIHGSDYCPSVPDVNFDSLAEEAIGKLKVRNDKLVLGSEVISNQSWIEEKTNKPILLESEDEIGQDVLYQNGLAIPKDTPNMIFESTGIITYGAQVLIGTSQPDILTFEIEELEQVVVHTPTVCDAYISDERQYNQMISPDRTRDSLVLDRTFQLSIPTEGEHLDIQGYGYRDYAKYIACRQVQFPFDIYQGTQFYSANSWITIDFDTTTFYVPIWVKEGKYSIQCRTMSISCEANDGIEKEEEFANLQLDNYAATCEILIEVSGRIYGFQITDVTDYPIWYSVFRKKNSLSPSGITYGVGLRNENGGFKETDSMFTIPLFKGSHPTNQDAGVVPTGYAFRFTIDTIGEMYDENDYVQLTPKFYYISSDQSQRQEVDLYYMETIENYKYAMVKIGSELDRTNVKKRYMGNPYMTVPKEELQTKAELTGKTLHTIQYTLSPMFTFHHILLSETFRTYLGKNYTPTGNIPNGVDSKKVALSKQKWYGEYYLPSKVYVVPKDFDLADYEAKNGAFHFREAFWLTEGYIMIQFEIKTINEGKSYLSYINAENAKYGYCNMWKKEGVLYQKTDLDGVQWKFEDGDAFLYDRKRRVGLDYIVGGTH